MILFPRFFATASLCALLTTPSYAMMGGDQVQDPAPAPAPARTPSTGDPLAVGGDGNPPSAASAGATATGSEKIEQTAFQRYVRELEQQQDFSDIGLSLLLEKPDEAAMGKLGALLDPHVDEIRSFSLTFSYEDFSNGSLEVLMPTLQRLKNLKLLSLKVYNSNPRESHPIGELMTRLVPLLSSLSTDNSEFHLHAPRTTDPLCSHKTKLTLQITRGEGELSVGSYDRAAVVQLLESLTPPERLSVRLSSVTVSLPSQADPCTDKMPCTDKIIFSKQSSPVVAVDEFLKAIPLEFLKSLKLYGCLTPVSGQETRGDVREASETLRDVVGQIEGLRDVVGKAQSLETLEIYGNLELLEFSPPWSASASVWRRLPPQIRALTIEGVFTQEISLALLLQSLPPQLTHLALSSSGLFSMLEEGALNRLRERCGALTSLSLDRFDITLQTIQALVGTAQQGPVLDQLEHLSLTGLGIVLSPAQVAQKTQAEQVREKNQLLSQLLDLSRLRFLETVRIGVRDPSTFWHAREGKPLLSYLHLPEGLRVLDLRGLPVSKEDAERLFFLEIEQRTTLEKVLLPPGLIQHFLDSYRAWAKKNLRVHKEGVFQDS